MRSIRSNASPPLNLLACIIESHHLPQRNSEDPVNTALLKKPSKKASQISLFSATALGIGGMMGAGLFSLLGTANVHAGTHIPIAF
jgi:hypothetical protein